MKIRPTAVWFALFLIVLTQIFPPPARAVFGCAGVDIVHTELGDFCKDPPIFIKQIIELLVGVAGGISLILFLVGAGKYMLSQGNPEGTEEAKKIITQALGGVILVFLSVFLVRFIGIDILAIPGLAPFGTGGFCFPKGTPGCL